MLKIYVDQKHEDKKKKKDKGRERERNTKNLKFKLSIRVSKFKKFQRFQKSLCWRLMNCVLENSRAECSSRR